MKKAFLFIAATVLVLAGLGFWIMNKPAGGHSEDQPAGTSGLTALAFGIGTVGVQTISHGQPTKKKATTEAMILCREKTGGDCFAGPVYENCGAVAELLIHNPDGNPVGWASEDDLATAQSLAMGRCTQGARKIGLKKYKDDATYLPRVKTARCAIVYSHCQSWGVPNLEEILGIPET